jgi:hypothetical protein
MKHERLSGKRKKCSSKSLGAKAPQRPLYTEKGMHQSEDYGYLEHEGLMQKAATPAFYMRGQHSPDSPKMKSLEGPSWRSAEKRR